MRPLIVALLLAVASLAHAQDRSTFNPNRKMDGHNDANGRSMYNAGRMPEMPSGPNKLQCWIVVSDNWERNALEYSLAQAIRNDPRMQQIKAGTYFNYYTVSNPKFSQSGLVGAVGTATPIFVVTRNDGGIVGDGSGGLFVNAQSSPKTADECIDMLCDAIAQMNPPPVVEGQTTNSQIIRESSAPCPDCVPTPQPTVTPNGGGTLTPIKPRKTTEHIALGVGVLVVSGLLASGVILGVRHLTKVKP